MTPTTILQKVLRGHQIAVFLLLNCIFILFFDYLSLVFLLISNLTNGLCLHQFLGTKTTEANKSLKTDANGAH